MAFNLEASYRDHHRLVRWIVRGSGVPESAVDDVVQDVFVAAYRRRRAAPPDDLQRWIVGVAKSVSFNFRRGLQRRKLRDDVWSSHLDHAERRMEDNVSHRLDLQRVMQAVESLEAPQREAFIMIELAGMNAMEASSVLGVSPNTVASRLRLARRKLRDVPCSVTEELRHEHEPSPRRAHAMWLVIAARTTGRAATVWLAVAAGAVSAALGGSLHWGIDAMAPTPLALRTPLQPTISRPVPVPRLPPLFAAEPDEPAQEAPMLAAPRPARASMQPLQREAALLQKAAQTIDRGDWANASAILKKYTIEFPHGQLDEERGRLQRRLDVVRTTENFSNPQ